MNDKDKVFAPSGFENPYSDGIGYDLTNIQYPIVVQEYGSAQIYDSGRADAQQLVRFLNGDSYQVLDLGSGTGICTLEIFRHGKAQRVIGIEIKPGMLEVAKFKFNQVDAETFLSKVPRDANFGQLSSYWKAFREESYPYKNRTEFQLGDIQNMDNIPENSVGAVIANQVLHWTDLSKTFSELHQVLKEGGEVIWNSASFFYDDKEFPAQQYSFRYNLFLVKVIEEVCAQTGWKANDYLKDYNPQQNLDSICRITAEQGFETKQVGTFMSYVDLQFFLQGTVPGVDKKMITGVAGQEELEDSVLDAKISEAIAKTITSSEALLDMQHKYDIQPIFKSVKK